MSYPSFHSHPDGHTTLGSTLPCGRSLASRGTLLGFLTPTYDRCIFPPKPFDPIRLGKVHPSYIGGHERFDAPMISTGEAGDDLHTVSHILNQDALNLRVLAFACVHGPILQHRYALSSLGASNRCRRNGVA